MSAAVDLQTTEYDRFLYWLTEWALASQSWEGPKGLRRASPNDRIAEWGPDVQRIENALTALGLEDAERLRAIKDVYLGHLNNTSAAIARRWEPRRFERYLAESIGMVFDIWRKIE